MVYENISHAYSGICFYMEKACGPRERAAGFLRVTESLLYVFFFCPVGIDHV